MWATEEGHEAMVVLLLEWGVAVQVIDKVGYTLLMYAAKEGHNAAVEKLLARDGVGLNFKDPGHLIALL